MSDQDALLLAGEIREFITSYVETGPDNYSPYFHDRYFDSPLVGFARADDPIFLTVKEQVGPYSLTPYDALHHSIAARGLSADLSQENVHVISWVLPISPGVREKNRLQKTAPAPEWSYTRDRGEKFNGELRRQVVNWLETRGYVAAAPFLLPDFRIIRDPARRNFTSTWSERHVAFACGLGTFSLTDALITPRGIAHRLGSVVVNVDLSETARPYTEHMEYCLSSRGCTACIRRCPVRALSLAGHDKDFCYEMVQAGSDAAARRERLGLEKTGCGLCQVGVPCEDRIPVKTG
ncbi:MAG TPA: hypothetical protein VMW83_04400 [Spirochaetia bacterium]|nr:hypothetical protein [Spirochaetia bacterium]